MLLGRLNFRRDYFQNYLPKLEANSVNRIIKNTCPSCGIPTLEHRIGCEMCSICSWEDDGQDDHDADEVYRGPNGADSLTDSRLYCDEEFEELKRESTKPGAQLIRIDALIIKNDVSDLKEILELIDIV